MPEDDITQNGTKESSWVTVEESNQNQKSPNTPTIATDKTPTGLASVASKLKIGIQKFSAMPVEQSDPNLPKLTTQSPPTNLPPPPLPLVPKGSPFRFLSVFSIIFNWATFFLAITIIIFLIASGLILAYTNYTVFSPPKFFKDFLNVLITNTPLPDKVESLPNLNFKK